MVADKPEQDSMKFFIPNIYIAYMYTLKSYTNLEGRWHNAKLKNYI